MSLEKGDWDSEKVNDGVRCERSDCEGVSVELGETDGNLVGFCYGHRFSWVEMMVIGGLTLSVGAVIALGIVSVVAWVNFVQLCVVVINLLLGAIKGYCIRG